MEHPDFFFKCAKTLATAAVQPTAPKLEYTDGVISLNTASILANKILKSEIAISSS